MRPFKPIAGVVLASVLFSGILVAPSHAAAAPAHASSVASATAGFAEQSVVLARPGNGKILFAGIVGGRGQLTIKNRHSKDAVITLMKGKKKAISVFVRARSTAKVKNIKDGTYRAYYTIGYRFDTGKRRFTRSASYHRSNGLMKFRTTTAFSTIFTFTLYTARGGNSTSVPVNPRNFPT